MPTTRPTRPRRRTRTTSRSTRSQYKLYGRKIQLVRIRARGSSRDEVAAKADADKAAAEGVFAVIGGPAQTQSFPTSSRQSTSCASARARRRAAEVLRGALAVHLADRPVARADGQMIATFIKKQLVGKNAEFGGDAAEEQAAHVRALELRHPRRPVQGVVGRLRQRAEGRGRAHGRPHELLPQPRRRSPDRRAHGRDEAEGEGRDERHLHRRPDLPAVPHEAR